MKRATLLLFMIASSLARSEDLPFFDKPSRIDIRLTDDAIRLLETNPRQFVRAEVKAGTNTSREVPLRLKGSGTFRPIHETPSFTIQFGTNKVHLNNSLDDPGRMNEFVGAHLATHAGFDARKVGHGVVTLNDRRLGLYVVKEGFETEFAEPPTNSAMSWEQLKAIVDVDRFSGFVALEVMMCHWDGYALRRNNFHIEKDPNGKIHFVPSGMDQLFAKPDLNWQPDMTGPLARALMASTAGRSLYKSQFQKIFTKVYHSTEIRKLVESRLAELKPILSKSEFTEIQTEAAELCDRIQQREAYLKKELSEAPATYHRTGVQVAEKLLSSQGLRDSVDLKPSLL